MADLSKIFMLGPYVNIVTRLNITSMTEIPSKSNLLVVIQFLAAEGRQPIHTRMKAVYMVTILTYAYIYMAVA